MTDPVISAPKTPGIVIFVAVLNFLASFFLFLLAAASLTVLIFGNMPSVYDFLTKQIPQVQPNPTVGLNVIFGAFLIFGALLGIFYLLIGLGLLKGRKLAWFFQIALSVLGLLGFPFGTVLNALILVFFFLPSTREYFKV